MNEEQSGSEDQPIVVDQTDKRSVVPFVAAAVIAVVVLIGIVLGGLLSPAEKNVTEADRLTAAVSNYIDARSRSELRPPPGVACPGFDEEKSGLSERLGGPKSAVTIDKKGFDKATVNGDRAKIDATVQIGDTSSTSTWNLTRVDGAWLVCTP
ncbi:Rv0361 family membrane protein [Nocardia sp. NPDC055053]